MAGKEFNTPELENRSNFHYPPLVQQDLERYDALFGRLRRQQGLSAEALAETVRGRASAYWAEGNSNGDGLNLRIGEWLDGHDIPPRSLQGTILQEILARQPTGKAKVLGRWEDRARDAKTSPAARIDYATSLRDFLKQNALSCRALLETAQKEINVIESKFDAETIHRIEEGRFSPACRFFFS